MTGTEKENWKYLKIKEETNRQTHGGEKKKLLFPFHWGHFEKRIFPDGVLYIFFIYFRGVMELDDMADEHISVMRPGTNETL